MSPKSLIVSFKYSSLSPSLQIGQRCVDTFSAGGYECFEINETASVVVDGASLTPGQLNDLIQTFIEDNLVCSKKMLVYILVYTSTPLRQTSLGTN